MYLSMYLNMCSSCSLLALFPTDSSLTLKLPLEKVFAQEK